MLEIQLFFEMIIDCFFCQRRRRSLWRHPWWCLKFYARGARERAERWRRFDSIFTILAEFQQTVRTGRFSGAKPNPAHWPWGTKVCPTK